MTLPDRLRTWLAQTAPPRTQPTQPTQRLAGAAGSALPEGTVPAHYTVRELVLLDGCTSREREIVGMAKRIFRAHDLRVVGVNAISHTKERG